MKVSLLLDSGAFTAWSKRGVVDLDAYIDFIKEYDAYLDYYVNLDCIPGEWGRKPTRDEFELSAAQGYKNYEYMLKAGVNPDKLIHVFHQHEDWRWLKRMVREIPYIGLSPANDSDMASKRRWLDECMNYVTDSDGYPLVKFHGFAVTSVELMYKYPWYSVDSATWKLTSGYGSIIVPAWNENGEFVYDRRPLSVRITRMGLSRELMGRRFDFLTEQEKMKVLEYVESKGFVFGKVKIENGELKVIEEGLVTQYRQRELLNMIFFEDFRSRLEPFPHRRYQRKALATQEFDIGGMQ